MLVKISKIKIMKNCFVMLCFAAVLLSTTEIMCASSGAKSDSNYTVQPVEKWKYEGSLEGNGSWYTVYSEGITSKKPYILLGINFEKYKSSSELEYTIMGSNLQTREDNRKFLLLCIEKLTSQGIDKLENFTSIVF